jgi:ankyrin repeat protein
VNATDDRGFTPLHIALQRNDSKLTALLQSYGGRDTAGR